MKNGHLLMIVPFLAVGITISGCTTLFRDADADNDSDKQTAETIIIAIDQYQLDHGEFPDSLDLLVPDYLTGIPGTIRGGDFEYYPFHDSDRGDDYELCFYDDTTRSTDYGCCYMWWFDNPPNYDGWDCTQGIDH